MLGGILVYFKAVFRGKYWVSGSFAWRIPSSVWGPFLVRLQALRLSQRGVMSLVAKRGLPMCMGRRVKAVLF